MKTSTEIASLARLVGEEKAIELIAKAGFTAWDFSMFSMCRYEWSTNSLLENFHPLAGNNYLKFARKLHDIGFDNGIICNQSHAPFPTKCAEIRSYYKRAIECTAEAGGSICIIHPDNDLSPEKNAEMYFELLPFAKEHNVKIATENMWNWDHENDMASPAACSDHKSFNAHLDAVNDDYFVACLDIGHAEMKGLNTSSVDMINTLGNRLEALHIHDNDLWHDSHILPFDGKIDFNKIIKALKMIDYKGYLTLEADRFLADYTKETAFDGVKKMAECAKKLAKLYDKA